MKAGEPVRLTGQYQPTVWNQHYTSMQFTAHGYKLVTKTISVQEWFPAENLISLPMKQPEGLQYKDAPPSFLHYQTDTGLTVKSYKNTSGLLLMAKNDKASLDLSNQFFDHTVERKYHALVWG